MKHKYLYLISSILMLLYLFSMSLILKVDYTYSYKTYYIDGKTKWWVGNDGLLVNFNSEYIFNQSTEGYQYLGRDFIYGEVNDIDKTFEEIKFDEVSTIYYQIKDNEINNKYIIILNVSDNSSNFEFVLNGKTINSVKEENNILVSVEESVECNELKIKGNENINLYGISFIEVVDDE